MDTNSLLNILKEYSDVSLQNFSSPLFNTNLLSLGIKIPTLKELAKQYQNEDFLDVEINKYVEIDIFLGFVNKFKFKNYEERLFNLEYLFKGESSWAITDSVICFNKKKDRGTNMFFFKKRINSKYLFLKRLGFVLYIATLKEDKEALDILLKNSKQTDIYYVDMAIAWALATASINYENEIYEYLKTLDKDLFIKTKTIRKIKDSFRNTNEFKNKLSNL